MLTVNNIYVSYGQIEILKGISLKVNEGEIVTLIGANGAGKTTTLKTVAGLLHPKSGAINFTGISVDHTPAYNIVRLGLSLVPEGRKIFPALTVLENLHMGAYTVNKKTTKTNIERVFSLFPVLSERYKQSGGTLSGGEQQMLAIGRALMAAPKLLLLDEPSLGLAPMLVKTIFKIITDINAQGVSILLIEQNANMALQIAKRGYVLENGKIVMSDTASALLKSDTVRKAYLGV